MSRAFDANAKVRPRGANALWPRPPRRRVARREGVLVRLVDGIAHRQWLCGLAHRTTERLVLIGRDRRRRTGCAVGVHASYDGTPRRMANGSCSDRLVGGARASYPGGSVRRHPVLSGARDPPCKGRRPRSSRAAGASAWQTARRPCLERSSPTRTGPGSRSAAPRSAARRRITAAAAPVRTLPLTFACGSTESAAGAGRHPPPTRGMGCGRACSCVQRRVQPTQNTRWLSQTQLES